FAPGREWRAWSIPSTARYASTRQARRHSTAARLARPVRLGCRPAAGRTSQSRAGTPNSGLHTSWLFFLLQFKSDRAYRKLQAYLNADRQLPLVIGEPYVQVALTPVEHFVKQKRFVTNGLERACGNFDLLAYLRFHFCRYAFLSIAHRNFDGTPGLEVDSPEIYQGTDHVVHAAGGVDLFRQDHSVFHHV